MTPIRARRRPTRGCLVKRLDLAEAPSVRSAQTLGAKQNQDRRRCPTQNAADSSVRVAASNGADAGEDLELIIALPVGLGGASHPIIEDSRGSGSCRVLIEGISRS